MFKVNGLKMPFNYLFIAPVNNINQLFIWMIGPKVRVPLSCDGYLEIDIAFLYTD